MIKPDRYLNPDWSVISISAFILEQLNSLYETGYDTLLNKVERNLGTECKENFPYALSFLFIFGKIEYIEEKDSFKLNETK